MKKGWICPKCDKVYAPNVAECYSCNAPAAVSTKPATVTTTWINGNNIRDYVLDYKVSP